MSILVTGGLGLLGRQTLERLSAAGRKAVMGALSLYLNFINLFMMVLRLTGGRR